MQSINLNRWFPKLNRKWKFKFFKRKKKIRYSVDSLTIQPRQPTFTPIMFRKMEWPTLQVFCEKYHITQKDLIIVFESYLTHEEVFLRQFRIRTLDLKYKFQHFSLIIQELADILLPTILLKPFTGLDGVDTPEEISFTRFVIMSYIFACQTIGDVIYDYISIIKRNSTMQITSVLPVKNMEELFYLMIEDFPKNGTMKLLKECIHKLVGDDDIRLYFIIRLGIKYPMLFYCLEKFRKIIKHYVFGEEFYQNKKYLKLKIDLDISDIPENYHDNFLHEPVAMIATAKALILDALLVKTRSKLVLNDTFYEEIHTLNEKQVIKLKSILGYELTKLLIIESKIEIDFDSIFIEPYLDHPEEEKANEPMIEEMFATGDNNNSLDLVRAMTPSRTITSPKKRSPSRERSPGRNTSPWRGFLPKRLLSEEHEAIVTRALSPLREMSPMRLLSEEQALTVSKALTPLREMSPLRILSPFRKKDDAMAFEPDRLTSPGLFSEDNENQYEDDGRDELDRQQEIIIVDKKNDRRFVYNMFTGRTRWAKIAVDPDGEILREVF